VAERVDCFESQPCLKLDCPALRILRQDENIDACRVHEHIIRILPPYDYQMETPDACAGVEGDITTNTLPHFRGY
jgi:hypothetical protein